MIETPRSQPSTRLELVYSEEKAFGYQHRNLEINGRNYHYVTAGKLSAPPVIFLHGAFDKSNLSWRHALKPIADKDFRVISLDLPGYGESSQPENYDNQTYVDSLCEFADALEIESASLVALSKGGAIAAGFALQYPEKVRSQVLVAPWGFGSEMTLPIIDRNKVLKTTSIPVRETIRMAHHLPGISHALLGLERTAVKSAPLKDFAINFVLSRIVAESGNVTQELRREVLESVTPKSIETFFRWLQGQMNGSFTSFTDQLGAIATPTLFIHGRKDKLVPFSWSENAVKQMPDAQLYDFHNCGHIVPRESPDEFNKAIGYFLQDTAAAA